MCWFAQLLINTHGVVMWIGNSHSLYRTTNKLTHLLTRIGVLSYYKLESDMEYVDRNRNVNMNKNQIKNMNMIMDIIGIRMMVIIRIVCKNRNENRNMNMNM